MTPTLKAISVSFPFSWAAQSGAWGPASLDTSFLYRILSRTGLVSKLIDRRPEGSLCWVLAFSTAPFSPTGLVSKLTDFLSSPSDIIVQHPPSSCGRHNFALIQPVHDQGNNILIIPRPDAPVIYIGAFPILTTRSGRRSIYNKEKLLWFLKEERIFGEVNTLWQHFDLV